MLQAGGESQVPRCELGFGLGCWHQAASVGGVQAGLHLPTEPDFMLGRFLLLLHELTQEVARKLRAVYRPSRDS